MTTILTYIDFDMSRGILNGVYVEASAQAQNVKSIVFQLGLPRNVVAWLLLSIRKKKRNRLIIDLLQSSTFSATQIKIFTI